MSLPTKHPSGAPRAARALWAAGLFSGLLLGSGAQAAITFQFDYSGNAADVGFLDPVYGAQRRQALTEAGNLFSSLFGSHFGNSGTITLAVTSTDDASSGTLASAGSDLLTGGASGFTLVEVIRTKLTTGVDRNGSAADGVVDVNWGYNWQLDPHAHVSYSGEQFDFYAAVNHEFTHALGFSSTVGATGRDLWGQRNPGEYNAFDSFLADASGASLISATGLVDRDAWIAAATGGSTLYFNGSHAVAANGGQLVGLYSPTTWLDGSSGSHLDTDQPLYANMMMVHDRGYGAATRSFSAVEVGILTDLGYSVAAVPEPASYALLLAGFGVVGWCARRRRG